MASLPLSDDNSISSNRDCLINVNITHSYNGIAHSPQKDKMYVHMRKYDDLYDKIGLKKKNVKHTHACVKVDCLERETRNRLTVTASR